MSGLRNVLLDSVLAEVKNVGNIFLKVQNALMRTATIPVSERMPASTGAIIKLRRNSVRRFLTDGFLGGCPDE